jgi:hypothetical protein
MLASGFARERLDETRHPAINIMGHARPAVKVSPVVRRARGGLTTADIQPQSLNQTSPVSSSIS